MNMIVKITAATSLLLGACNAKIDSTTYAERIDNIATIASDYAGFNGTVLVANADGIVYEKSFGFADIDNKVPLTPEYRFSPGSIDKEFTTAALMLLEERGVISYSDTLSKYLPDLPNWARIVTIEQILTHTSGLPDIRYGRGLTTANAIDQIMAVDKLNYTPGEGFTYGNLHSVLRTMVIEKASGQLQDVFIKENIFDPAGMDTAFSKTDVNAVPPMVAAGEAKMAVAGIDQYVTTRDLYNWEMALWTGKIVSQPSLEYATQPHTVAGNKNRAYFDFGFFTAKADGSIIEIQHDGTHPRHFALQSFNFDSGLVIILLSRDGNKATLAPLNQAITALADQPMVQIPTPWWLTREQKQTGMTAALDTLKAEIKSGVRKVPDEPALNSMGYALSIPRTIHDALAVLKLNLEFYPGSANAHDSYADILLKAKKYDEAKTIAERGLDLATQEGNDILIKSMSGYLNKIDAAKQP